MHISGPKDRSNGGASVFRRARHRQSEPIDERPENLLGLRNIAKTQRWVLEGTYYADTGEAPAESGVFASLQESQACSELLHRQFHDPSAVKKMWQDLTNNDVSLFVNDADRALQVLRDKAKELRAKKPSTE